MSRWKAYTLTQRTYILTLTRLAESGESVGEFAKIGGRGKGDRARPRQLSFKRSSRAMCS